MHFGFWRRSKLWSFVWAGSETPGFAFIFAKTSLTIHDHYAIFSSFENCMSRTCFYTNRVQAMVTWCYNIAHKYVRVTALFVIKHPYPILESSGDIVPVLTRYAASATTGATGLVKIETNLQSTCPFLYSPGRALYSKCKPLPVCNRHQSGRSHSHRGLCLLHRGHTTRLQRCRLLLA